MSLIGVQALETTHLAYLGRVFESWRKKIKSFQYKVSSISEFPLLVIVPIRKVGNDGKFAKSPSSSIYIRIDRTDEKRPNI